MQQEKVKKFHLLLWEAIVLLPYGKSVPVHYLLPLLCISIQASPEVGDILYLNREKEQKNVSIQILALALTAMKLDTKIHCILYKLDLILYRLSEKEKGRQSIKDT